MAAYPSPLGAQLPKTLIIWVNPVSTNARRSQRVIGQIQDAQAFQTISVLRTTDAGRQANQEALRELLKKQSEPYWLLVAGGDGTISAASEVIRALGQSKLAHIWVFPAGNGNDISSMIHGRGAHRFTPEKLARAKTVHVHPLICQVTYPDKKQRSFVAIAYIGFGSSAHTATAISRGRQRAPELAASRTRILREAYTVLRVAYEARSFTVETDSKRSRLFERLIVNGHRIGKNTLWPGNSLTADSYRDVSIPITSKVGAVRTFLRLLTRQLNGSQKRRQDVVTFSLPEGGDMQCDGEAQQLPAGSKIKITMDAEALSFLQFAK